MNLLLGTRNFQRERNDDFMILTKYIFNKNMTQRLSKLAEYLYNNNFEMAVQYNEKERDYRRVSQEPEEVRLLLAKAYFLNEKYSTSIELTEKLKTSHHIKIVYQAYFLEFKSKYMHGDLELNILKDLMQKLKRDGS